MMAAIPGDDATAKHDQPAHLASHLAFVDIALRCDYQTQTPNQNHQQTLNQHIDARYAWSSQNDSYLSSPEV